MHVNWTLLLRQAAAGAILLAVAACSTADYGQPVDDFAAATGEAESALSELNVQVTEAYTGVLQKRIVERRATLKYASEDCLTTSERCRLIVIKESGEVLLDGLGQPQRFPPEPPLARMTLVMADINRYAANLKALLEADTAKQVEGQVNAALGSVQKLAETVAEARAEAGGEPVNVPAFATPVGAGVNWIVGQYIERIKYSGLRDATEAAQPVVRQAADLFTVTSEFVADVPKSILAEEVSLANDSFRSSVSAASLDKLTASAAKYDALLTSTPPDLFRRLRVAHDALADSLQGGDITIATAIARIKSFAAEAKKLAKILKDIRAIIPDDDEE